MESHAGGILCHGRTLAEDDGQATLHDDHNLRDDVNSDLFRLLLLDPPSAKTTGENVEGSLDNNSAFHVGRLPTGYKLGVYEVSPNGSGLCWSPLSQQEAKPRGTE